MKKTPSTDSPLQLNLTKIVRDKIGGWKGRVIPSFLLHYLEKLIRQDELNEILRVAHPHMGSAFSERVLEHLDICIETEGLDALPEEGRYVFASNHPLGGLDGIALVAVLGRKYGDDNIKVLVNDLLMNVKPLANVFLPVNKFGSQGRENIRLLNEALSEGKQLVMFPAGLVSRLHDDGSIRDLAWQKAFLSKALEYDREIVPVKFEGLNSMKFYKTARRRKKLGIKINVEQTLLPSEVCKSKGKRFVIKFDSPVSPSRLKEEGKTSAQIISLIYDRVYSL